MDTKDSNEKVTTELEAKKAAEAKAKAEKETREVEEAKAKAGKTASKDSKLDALIASYRKAYPREKTFHVTSDYQVFLKTDAALAKMHQRSVDKEKSIQTINVK